MAILNHGSTIRTADGGQSTTTIVTASNIGTYGVAANSPYFIGTTQNVFNRASGAQTLTGVSIDGNAATVTNGVYTTGTQSISGAKTFNDVSTFGSNVTLTSTSQLFIGSYMSLQSSVSIMGMVGFNRKVSDGTIFNSSYAAYQLHNDTGTLNLQIYTSAGGFVGAHTFNSSGNITFIGSTTSSTDLRAPIFYDSANTAYYLDPANTGTSLLVAGKVGIGTTSPAYKLDVGASGSDAISVRLTPGFERVRYYGFDLLGYNDGNLWMIGNNATNTLVLGGSWDWDRQIAIAYTPATTGAAGGSLEIGQMTKNNANFTHGNTRFYTNGIERVRINSSGNVGMGTTSPSAKLHIYNSTAVDTLLESGTSGTTGKLIFKTSDNADLNKYIMQESYYMILNGHTNEGFKFRDSASNVLLSIFGAANTYASRVGIGTQTPAYKLDVSGAINASTYMYAGVFYDNDNTAFYANPSGASIFNGLKLVSSGNQVSGDDYSLWIQGGNDDWGIGIIKSTANYGITYNLASSHTYGIQGAKNGTEYFRVGTDMLSHDTRLQAPIFYDSDNTAYYLDPSNTGTSLNTAGAVVAGTYVYSTTYLQAGNNNIYPNGFANTLILNVGNSAGNNWITGVSIAQGGNVGIGTTSPSNPLHINTSANEGILVQGSTAGSWMNFKSSTSNLLSIGADGTLGLGFYNRTSSTYLAIISNSGSLGIGTTSPSQKLHVVGTGFASTDFRAPIFYDSNNTSYYLDPASTSVLNALTVGGNNVLTTASTLTAGNLSGTIPSAVLGNSTVNIGTTAIALNRGSASQTLTGVSIDGNAATVTNGVYTTGNQSIAGNKTFTGITSFTNASDYQISLNGSGTTWAGIEWVDSNGTDYMWYNGQNKTFAIGGGGSNISGKKLHVDGGVTIGADYDSTVVPANGLSIQGAIQIGDYYIFPINSLSSSTTQARTFEIARIGIDFNDWNGTGTFEVELHEQYYSRGLKKVYNIWYGYVSNSGIRLVEWRGNGDNNFQCRIGSQVLVSGDHYYLPVFVDVRNYGIVDVVVKTNRLITTNTTPAIGYTYVNTAPTPTNITDFTADSDLELSTLGSAKLGGNTILTSNNYSGYSTFSGSVTSTYGNFTTPGLIIGDAQYGFYVVSGNVYYKSASGGVHYWRNIANNADIMSLNNSGTLTLTGDVRAPVFYDSASTSYYCDPNGVSNLYGVAIRGDAGITNTDNQIFFWGTGNTTTSAIGFKANGNAFPNPTGAGDGYNTYLTMDTDGRGWVFRRGTGGTDFTAAYTSGWILNNGIWQANASMRSPIFYDSNDTNYYGDFASTSRLNILNLVSYGYINGQTLNGQSFFQWEGATFRNPADHTPQLLIRKDNSTTGINGFAPALALYNNNGADQTTVGMAFVSAEAVSPTQGNSVELAGIIAKKESSGTAGGWSQGSLNFFVKDFGTRRDVMSMSPSGVVTAFVDVRAPIFYDSNNTAFYCDPTATSNFTGLTVANTITGSVSGNAGTATILQTARNINGTSFNGSAAITTATWGTARTITIGSTGKSVDGSAAVSWSLAEIGAAAIAQTMFIGTTSVAINRASASQTLTGVSIDGSSASCTGNSATTTLATKATRANGNFYIDDNYGNTIVGLYSANRYQGVFAMGDSYKLAADGLGVGTLYGIAWSHPNAGGVAANLNDHGALILLNGTYAAAISSSIRCATDMRTPIYYDSNNTVYYCDPASTSNLNAITAAGNITAAQYYTGGWFRNNGSGNGLYNESTGQHFYSDSANYWNVASSAGAQGIRLRTGGHNGTVRGYFYADTNNDVGFLNQDGSWRLRVVGGDYALADGSSMRAQIFYDSNDTSYYVDAASTSILNRVNYQQLRRNFGASVYSGPPSGSNIVKTFSGVLVAGSANGSTNTYTVIETSIPQGNYQMGGFTIKWFENYSSTNAKTTIEIAGYWNPTSNGGFVGFEFTSSNPNVQPTIQVGANASGNTVFILTHYSSSYPVIVARDLWFGYNSSDAEYGTGWTMTNTNSLAAYSNIVSATLRVGPTLTGTGASGTWGISITGSSASSTGNAATATTLQTARNINGTSFNGSANITTASWGTARTITIGSTGKSVDGSGNVSWSLAEIGAAATNQTMFIGTTSVAINRASASQTLSGISIDGNAATVTAGVYTNVNNTLTGINYFTSNLGTTSGSLSNPPLQAFASGTNAAFMSFHRGGSYAVNMGLDSDNILRIGGWSASANRWELDMSGNNWVASSFRAPIFYDSNNTAYYIDGASGSKLKYLQIDGDWGSSPFGSGQESFTIRSTYASICQRQTNGSLGYWLHHVASDGVYNLYGGRGATDGNSWDWSYRAYPNQDGSFVEFRTSARAPIFYDSNNTAYYVDPSSTSNLVGLTVANTITGSITGNAGGSSASCSGNAATATILQTARTIGGVSFNGSANINLPGVNTAGNQNTTGTAANVTGTVAIANGGTGATTAANAATNLGLGTGNTPKFLNVFGERVALNSASPQTINTQYNVTELTLTSSIATLTFSNIQAAGIVHMWTLVTVGNATVYTITWPAAVKWPGGTAPTLTTTSGKRDIYQFVTYDGGTNIYAIIVGQNL